MNGGLRSHQQNQLVTYHAKPVALHDRKVKTAGQLQELQISMKSNTQIENSQRKFDVNIKNLVQNEAT